MAYTGRLRSKGVSFYERVGILLVKVYEREEEFLISVCKKSQKGLQIASYACEKVEEMFVFLIFSNFKDSEVKRDSGF